MKISLAVLGFALAFGVLMTSVLTGIDDSDRDGRVPMPGKKSLRLAAGEYSVYYEEPHGTDGNQIFEPPEGIRVRVLGLRGAPDPILERGALGNQVGTDNRTAETIGLLSVAEEGRYRVVAGRPPAGRAAITLGEKSSASLLRGAGYAGLVAGVTALLILLVWVRQRMRRRGARETASAASIARWAPVATAGLATPPQAPAARDATPQAEDPTAQLERLAALRRTGAVSPEEFERLKRELL